MQLQPVVEAPRMRPVSEGSLHGVVAVYGFEEIVRGVLGFGLARVMDLETPNPEENVHQPRRESLAEDYRLGRAPDEQIPRWVLGGMEDGFGDDARLVDRRRSDRLDAQLGARLVEEGRVYRRRHHLGDADRQLLAPELHPQGLEEAVYAVLGGAVGALERDRTLGAHRGNVDQRPSTFALYVRQGGHRPVDLAHQVHVDHPRELRRSGPLEGSDQQHGG